MDCNGFFIVNLTQWKQYIDHYPIVLLLLLSPIPYAPLAWPLTFVHVPAPSTPQVGGEYFNDYPTQPFPTVVWYVESEYGFFFSIRSGGQKLHCFLL